MYNMGGRVLVSQRLAKNSRGELFLFTVNCTTARARSPCIISASGMVIGHGQRSKRERSVGKAETHLLVSFVSFVINLTLKIVGRTYGDNQ